MNTFLEEIIKEYSSLWKFKERGNCIEIITPMVTTTDMFVSVYLTLRGSEYIITDGGQMVTGMYDVTFDFDCKIQNKIKSFFLEQFDVSSTEGKGRLFFYKKVDNFKSIPKAVFDVSNFISSMVNSVDMPLVEERSYKQFRAKAKSFFMERFGDLNLEFDQPISSDYAVKFNVIARQNNGLRLINFVTGSSTSYYRNSLSLSFSKFQMIERTKYNHLVTNMITLMDDQNDAIYNSCEVKPFKDLLKESSDTRLAAFTWNERERVHKLII